MSRFVDPFTDIGFKIVFGKENKSNEFQLPKPLKRNVYLRT